MPPQHAKQVVAPALGRACAIANAAITKLIDTDGVLREPVGPGFVENPKHSDAPQFKGGVCMAD